MIVGVWLVFVGVLAIAAALVFTCARTVAAMNTARRDATIRHLQTTLEAGSREVTELHAQAVAQGGLILELQANLAARTQETDGLRREAEESRRLLLEARQSILGSLDAAIKGVVGWVSRKGQ